MIPSRWHFVAQELERAVGAGPVLGAAHGGSDPCRQDAQGQTDRRRAFSFVTSRDLTVLVASAETTVDAVACIAASIVASVSAAGTGSESAGSNANAPRAKTDGVTPRRKRYPRSRRRAWASRLLTVPTGQPRCRAVSS